MSETTAIQPIKETKEKAPLNIDTHGLVKCSTMDEAHRFANAVIQSGLAPSSFKSATAVLFAMQMGAELGLKPIQALQCIAVVNGRPTIYGKALPGIVLRHNIIEIFEEWTEGEGLALKAFCKVKRKGIETIRTEVFTAQDAQLAGLWEKTTTWKGYPKDMLGYKARARAFNALFADVLCGLPVTEDYQDNPTPRVNEPPAQPINDPLLGEVTATLEGGAK
jgi:hypothetical protein